MYRMPDIDDAYQELFATGVGLITSTGPMGDNVMAAEWTYAVSYDPPLIAVGINPKHATFENISATKEFGVTLAADDQATLANLAGSNSRRSIDKLSAFAQHFQTLKAQHIKAPLIAGGVFRAECKVLQALPIGDHVLFVGQVLAATADPAKIPLLYRGGRYFHLGERVQKPGT